VAVATSKDLSELRSRLTGFSLPVVGGGASWRPKEADVTAARRVLAYLADRRVLFDPYDVEIIDHCVQSVLDIRRMLTSTLAEEQRGAESAGYVDAMRAACRAFLTDVQAITPRERTIGVGTPSWLFNQALGIFRGRMGAYVGLLAAAHELDVPETLKSILPPTRDDGSEIDRWWPFLDP